MRFQASIAVVMLLVAAPFAVGHSFNHEDRHEVCEVDVMTPHGHEEGDGHAHVHNATLAEEMGLHDHDPCKQIRMDYPLFEDKAPVNEITPPPVEMDPLDLLFSDGDPNNTEVYVGGEAYQFPIPEGEFRKQSSLAVNGDRIAAGMGFPGSGTHDDPYIVEGYLITNAMAFTDTSACFVVRNNVIVDRTFVAPLIPDPENIIDLPELTPYWEQVKAEAEALREEYLNLSAYWDGLKQTWDDELALWDADKAVWDDDLSVWDGDKAAMEQTLDDYAAQDAQWQARFDQFEQDLLAAVTSAEGLEDDFDWYANEHLQVDPPTVDPDATVHQQYVADGAVTDMDALRAAFEAYHDEASAAVEALAADPDAEGEAVWDVRDMIDNPPPENPPPGFWGDAEDWEFEKDNWETYRQQVRDQVDTYWSVLIANAPSEAEYQAFLDEWAAYEADYEAFLVDYDAFVVTYNAFIADYDAFVADHDAFMVDYNAFQAEFDQVWADTGDAIAAADEHFAKVAEFTYEYGDFLFNTLDELLAYILELLAGILDPRDPNIVNDNQGQLILDWNGQCIHAYNNVIHDLRVNQNNDRTGYATGGIIEDNRIYTIGQIRHYDGIFRQNEVGSRGHLLSLIDPNVAAPGGRTVNNDGANQGWYVDNVFYGQIDLDFHGHHHSAGFFAPTSHYHGSNHDIAYMRNADGSCKFTHDDVDHMKANGPHHDYPTDNDVDVLGVTVVDGPDEEHCLPHMDHGKRWTSVLFTDNIVIDPNGVGLRFEDRNHRADDEQANSENMRELKQPHYHKKWVQMEDNVLVGKIFIDILNAKGTDLWSDDWSEVQSPSGPGRTVEALGHPGAEIVNSHPYRNDAWLDVNGNTIFLTQSVGTLVSDAEHMTLFQFKDNTGYGLPAGFDASMDGPALLQWLRESASRDADAVHADLVAWGGSDRGTQTLLSMHNVRDGYRVEHCGNTLRGLDRYLVATDRIYLDGADDESIIAACGPSDWGGADPAVTIAYTDRGTGEKRFTQPLRDATDDTDDFYVSEYAYDQADNFVSGETWDVVGGPPETPDPHDHLPGHGH